MKNNRLRLTWISFLSYGLTGALLIITSVLLGNIANYFNVHISRMSNIFTFLNLGILSAIFFNAWLIDIIPIKKQLIFGFFMIFIAVSGLMWVHSLVIFSILMFIFGMVSGITMSIGTYLITYLYHGKQRGSLLLFTDSFFSMAGTLFPMLAGVMLTRHITWYWIYTCIGLIYVLIFILTLMSDFPVIGKERDAVTSISPPIKENWGCGVILLAMSALCYILGQLGFISWIPEYATRNFKVDIQHASSLVSNFWTAYMVGMWVFSVALRFIDLQRILTLLSAISAILMHLCISTKRLEYLPYYLLILGFVSSSIYTSIITLGSQQTRISSPKIVNFILICGTTGTVLTFIVTGPIVAYYGITAALHISNIFYVAVFILCVMLGFFSRHRVNNKSFE